MTQYIIQNDNEEYMAAFSKKRITWTKAPECAKTFVTLAKRQIPCYGR